MAMRALVVGAGAVGGYFGARLAEAGRDVTFLVRASRATQLRRDGLRVVSPHGDVLLTPKLIGAGEIDGPYDLVLLSVKAYALEAAINDFAPAVGPETMILPVLNGMRHIDVLTQRFGESAVLGGVCLVATEIDDRGRIALPRSAFLCGATQRNRGPRPTRTHMPTGNGSRTSTEASIPQGGAGQSRQIPR